MKSMHIVFILAVALMIQACGSAPKKLMKDCERDGEFWRCSDVTQHDITHLKN